MGKETEEYDGRDGEMNGFNWKMNEALLYIRRSFHPANHYIVEM